MVSATTATASSVQTSCSTSQNVASACHQIRRLFITVRNIAYTFDYDLVLQNISNAVSLWGVEDTKQNIPGVKLLGRTGFGVWKTDVASVTIIFATASTVEAHQTFF